MNVDKCTQCGHFLLINEPGAVFVLYWVSYGSCDCIIIQVVFWIELPVQMRLFFIFVKLWISINGTQRYGIELHVIHRFSAS